MRFAFVLLVLAGLVAAAAAAESSIASVAAATPALSTLLAAVKAANLTKKLSNSKLVTTLFAPTNDAFAAYLSKNKLTTEQLLASPDLKWILKQHLVRKAAIKSSELINGATVKSWLPKTKLTIEKTKSGAVAVKTKSGAVAKVTKADVPAGASVVHLVDAVLVPTPEAIKEAPEREAAWRAKMAASPSMMAASMMAPSEMAASPSMMAASPSAARI